MPEHENDMNVDDVAFQERIKEVVDSAGGAAELARKTGLSRAVIDKYRLGLSDPSRKRLLLLAKAGNVSLSWLATGDNPQKTYAFSEKDQERYAPAGHQMASVPIMNVAASAGSGAMVTDEKASGFIAFSREWLHQHGLSPAELFSMPTIGESMEPTIKAGEYLLCSSAEHHLKPGDGIYVVRLEGDILVKRLQRLPGGIVQVSSDNTTFYKPFNITLNDGTDFCILGKVVIVHGARRV